MSTATTKSKGLASGRCLDLPTKVVFDGDSSQILDKCSLYGPPRCSQGRLSQSVFQADSRVGLPAKLIAGMISVSILRSSLRLSASKNAKDRREPSRNPGTNVQRLSATRTAPLPDSSPVLPKYSLPPRAADGRRRGLDRAPIITAIGHRYRNYYERQVLLRLHRDHQRGARDAPSRRR